MSRFRDDSELSRLNRDGRLAAREPRPRPRSSSSRSRPASTTGGLFDPTVHDAVVAAGYDRTFDELPADGRRRPAAAPTRTAAAAACGVDGPTIELEPGTRLDLGGIGKGYAVDRVAELLAAVGPCLVNAGGDLAVRGGAWPVGVTRRADARADARRHRHVRARPPPLARGGEERHHLIDPATGRPGGRRRRSASPSSPSRPRRPRSLAKAAFLGGRRRRCRTCSSPTTARTVLGGRPRMRHDPTFWLLARASGLTAYVMLTLSVLAGLVVKSRPFRVAQAGRGHRPPPHARAARARGARRPRRRARARHDREGEHRRALHSRPRLLPARLDVARRPRGGADGARLRLVLACASGSARRTGAACTGRRYAIFGRATVHGLAAGTRLDRPWALRALRAAPSARSPLASTWRFLVPPTPARARRRPGGRDAGVTCAACGLAQSAPRRPARRRRRGRRDRAQLHAAAPDAGRARPGREAEPAGRLLGPATRRPQTDDAAADGRRRSGRRRQRRQRTTSRSATSA